MCGKQRYGGEDIANSLEEEYSGEDILPTEYGVSQNFPNPFNPTTKIEIHMAESGSARLNVYNLLGEKVLTILDQELASGKHEITIDGSGLASGMYIYKLDVDKNFSEVKKMNLIK